jgi:hypothetical protein
MLVSMTHRWATICGILLPREVILPSGALGLPLNIYGTKPAEIRPGFVKANLSNALAKSKQVTDFGD